MTKLPKSLEKLRDEMAEACLEPIIPSWNVHIHKQIFANCFNSGFDAGALAVLAEAENLAEALSGWIDATPDKHLGIQRIEKILKAYREFTGEK